MGGLPFVIGIFDILYSRKLPERTGIKEKYHPIVKQMGSGRFVVSNEIVESEKPGAKYWREAGIEICIYGGIFVVISILLLVFGD